MVREKGEFALICDVRFKFSVCGGGDLFGLEPLAIYPCSGLHAERCASPLLSDRCGEQIAHSDQIVGSQREGEYPTHGRDTVVIAQFPEEFLAIVALAGAPTVGVFRGTAG